MGAKMELRDRFFGSSFRCRPESSSRPTPGPDTEVTGVTIR